MHRLLALILIAILLSGCVTELWGETLPGAYSQPHGQTQDIYRVGVIVCNNSFFTLIAVEIPSDRRMGGGWFVIALDVDLRPWCR